MNSGCDKNKDRDNQFQRGQLKDDVDNFHKKTFKHRVQETNWFQAAFDNERHGSAARGG